MVPDPVCQPPSGAGGRAGGRAGGDARPGAVGRGGADKIAREAQPGASPTGRCGEPPSGALLRGIAQFNAREYFECHETLELIWRAEPDPVRVLYKGILQVGVGCYHLLRHNYHGATVKLRSGAVYLEPFAPACMGVDVARLIADAHRLRAALVALGPPRFTEVDLALLPMVHVVSPSAASGG